MSGIEMAGFAFAALAAALHVFIFVLESFRWTEESTRKVFSIASVEEAEATKEMAFNQGFYNLFLAIMTLAGIIAAAGGNASAGLALMLAGTGSMLAAGIVLLLTSPDKRAAAVKQIAFPLLAVICLAVS